MARILVIEDNMANLDLMVYLLTAFGHRTLAAEDGEAGVQIARREHPDVIICDIQLPKKDGYTVARELKEDRSFPSIPLVAVTAFAMVGDRDQVLAAGFDGYISKPIVPETFVSQVEQFLAPRQRAPSLPSYPQAAPQAAVAHPLPVLSMVLLVDDSEVNLQLMCSMLEPFGYRTMVAHSVDQALALARQRTPDLVISDLHMPGRTGFDLICAFKADSALEKIKIIIHSATMRSELDRREALRLGATQCIIRPIEPQILLEAIDSCLRNEQER